jgi:glycolate oxidase
MSYFDSYDAVVSGVNNIIRERIFPATIDFMDKNSMNTVEKFYPCGLDIKKEAMLLVEIDGFESSMEDQQARVTNALMASGASDIRIAVDQNEKDSVWTARRASFAAAAKLAPDVISDDIVVPRESIAKMINGCHEICKKYNLSLCMVGHIGDGNLHPQIALDMSDDEQFKNYMSAKSEIYNLALELGGTISAEHGVGSEKISYANKALDANSIVYMKKIKKIFDPNGILNPAKIFAE